ncbi:MAG: acyltransferase family protein [Propionibacteriaceae bacterium]|nr:acyltransferase family protein [Propionibacteriaceae bacterium]
MRVGWLDAARGLGIVAIVIGHSYIPGQETEPLLVLLYSFHVPLFLFLAGLTFDPSKYRLARLLRRKGRTVVLPYFIWALVSIPVFVVLGTLAAEGLGRGARSFQLGDSLVGMLWSNPDGGAMKWNTPLWFLTALFTTQLVYWGLCWLMKGSLRQPWLILGASLVISWLSLAFLSPLDPPWSLERVGILLPFFALGSLVGPWALRIQGEGRRGWALLGGALMLGAAFGVAMANGPVDYVTKHFGSYGLFLLAASLGVAGVLLLALGLGESRLLRYLGGASLTILVLHKFPVVAAQVMIARTGFGGSSMDTLVIVAVAGMAMLASVAFHPLLRRCFPVSIGLSTPNRRGGPRAGKPASA